MSKPDAELRALIDQTGMTYARLAERLDVDRRSLSSYYTGKRKPQHRGMLIAALQLIVLEQRGVITAKLIEETMRQRTKKAQRNIASKCSIPL